MRIEPWNSADIAKPIAVGVVSVICLSTVFRLLSDAFLASGTPRAAPIGPVSIIVLVLVSAPLLMIAGYGFHRRSPSAWASGMIAGASGVLGTVGLLHGLVHGSASDAWFIGSGIAFIAGTIIIVRRVPYAEGIVVGGLALPAVLWLFFVSILLFSHH